MQNAARVGILVAVFVGLLYGAYAMLGRSLFQPAVKRYYADFEDANALVPGARIMISGVRVGNVSAVDLIEPRKARVTMLLDPKIVLPEGTVAITPSSLLGFGDTPIMLETPLAGGGAALAPDSVLVGKKAGPLDSISPDANKTVEELNAILAEVRTIVADKETKSDIKALIANSQATVASFGKLADRLDKVVASNQNQINQALTRGTAAIADVQRVTAAVAELIEGGQLQGDAKAILAQLKETSKEADQLVANMNTLVADPSISQTTRNVADMTETGKQIAADVKTMTETGKGIATDAKAVSENAITLSKNAITLTEKTEKVLDGAIELEEKLKGILDKVGAAIPGKGLPRPDITATMDLMRSQNLDRWRTDATLTYKTGGGRIDFGIYDAFEGNKITLQYGTKLDDRFSYRYGIFASKASAGVDYRFNSKLSLRNDFWDINNPRYDARLRYEFGNGLYGWAGVESIFRQNAPVFGIGIQR